MAIGLHQVKRTVRLTALSDEMPFDAGSLQRSSQTKGSQSESRLSSTGVTPSIKGSHLDEQRESTGVTLQPDSPNNGSQAGDQRESVVANSDRSPAPSLEERESTGVTLPPASPNNGSQILGDSRCLPSRLPLIEALTPVDREEQWQLTPVDSLSLNTRLPLQRESAGPPKGSQSTKHFELHGLRARVLQFLGINQSNTGLTHTTRLQREELASANHTTIKTVRTIIRRLEKDGLLERPHSLGGRGDSGIVFRVTDAGYEALRSAKGSQGADPKGVGNGSHQRESDSTLVSSSDLKTTTTDKDRAVRFQIAGERFGLLDIGIGANDLLQIWRKGTFQSEGDFESSLEHIGFYLGTSEANSLVHRKAWVTSQLAKGFYPEPAGFKSWEERQLEARLAAHREKLARLEALRKEEQDLAFSVWLAEQDDDARRKMLAGTVVDNVRGKMAEAVLRQKFSEATDTSTQ